VLIVFNIVANSQLLARFSIKILGAIGVMHFYVTYSGGGLL